MQKRGVGWHLPTDAGAAASGGVTPPGYRPRAPEHGALHRLVHVHLETFLAEARARSRRLGDPARLLALAPNPTVTLQLESSNGLCWSQVYAAPARRNDTSQSKDAAP